MRDTSVFMPLDDYFSRIGRRRAMLLCQLPITLAMALIAFFAWVFSPDSLQNPAFLLTLFLHLVIFLACPALPWDRLPAAAFTVIPLTDCLVLALTREVGGPVLDTVGLLLAFPVIWLAVSASRTRLALAVAAPLFGTIASPLLLGNGIERAELIHMIVSPVIMSALAFTAHLVANGVLRYRDARDQQDKDLIRLHESTQHHQQLLDTVLETVNVGVWAISHDGTDILTNRRLRAERARAQQMQGPNPFVPDAGPDDPAAKDQPAQLARRGGGFTDRLVRVGTGERQRSFSAAAKPFHDADGRLKGSVLAFTDVTALVNALAARENFVATVSHELRTPLTSMLGYLELLKDDPDTEYICIIERNAQRLLTLINDLLLVASEDIEIRRHPVNLSQLVAAAALSAEHDASARNIHIGHRIQPDIHARVDPGQFTRAIEQLLTNAIKFSPEGGQVTVTLQGNSGGLTCAVSDQGIGMTEEEQDQAFTKFFRSDHAMKTAVPGAGLGLSISKAIIEAHGGQITLTSQPGKGTTATIALTD